MDIVLLIQIKLRQLKGNSKKKKQIIKIKNKRTLNFLLRLKSNTIGMIVARFELLIIKKQHMQVFFPSLFDFNNTKPTKASCLHFIFILFFFSKKKDDVNSGF